MPCFIELSFPPSLTSRSLDLLSLGFSHRTETRLLFLNNTPSFFPGIFKRVLAKEFSLSTHPSPPPDQRLPFDFLPSFSTLRSSKRWGFPTPLTLQVSPAHGLNGDFPFLFPFVLPRPFERCPSFGPIFSYLRGGKFQSSTVSFDPLQLVFLMETAGSLTTQLVPAFDDSRGFSGCPVMTANSPLFLTFFFFYDISMRKAILD